MDLIRIRAPGIVYRIAQFLEIIISIFVIVAIIISLATVYLNIGEMLQNPADSNGLHGFLSVAFNVVIGIEFLKMLARHNMSSAVEVLLFAIARQMVIEHTTPIENLAMVTAIAGLFAIRKYLFIPGLDDKQAILEHRFQGEHHQEIAHSEK